MTLLTVQSGFLTLGDWRFRCATGKGGFSHDKKEGDGATPIGIYALRECWYRLDRLPPPKTGLPLKIIREDDGWSDDQNSPEYNTHVKLPYPHSHELLWRKEHVYDLIVPLGYNDHPVVGGKGSAIFMHVAKPGYTPTEGCVALALDDLLTLLAQVDTHTRIEIKQ